MLRTGLVMLSFTLFGALLAEANGKSPAAQERLKFEEIVPSSAWIVGVKRGFENSADEQNELALFKLWEEPAFQKFVAPVHELTGQAMAQGKASIRRASHVPVSQITEMLGGRIGFAMGGLAYFNGIPTPGLTLSVDITQREQAFLGFVERQLDRLPTELRGELVRGSFDYKGLHVETLSSDNQHGEVCYTRLQNLFLVSTSRHFLMGCVSNYMGHGDAALANMESFQRASSKIGRTDPNYLLHINGEAIGAALGSVGPLRGIASAFGMDSINCISFGGHLEQDRSRDVIYVDAPGPRRGLLASFVSRPLDPAAMAWAPVGASSCSVMHLDIAQAYTHFASTTRQSILDMVPPDMRSRANAVIDQAAVWLPLNVLGDIFEPIGGHLAYYFAPSQGALIPEVVASAPVNNAWRVESGLEKLSSLLPEDTLKVARYGESKIYYTKLNIGGFIIQPSVTVCGDRLIMSNSVMALKSAMKFATSDEPRLADSAEFKSAVENLQGHSDQFSYTNVGSTVAGFYGFAAPIIANKIQEFELPFNVDALPSAETIAQHLGGKVSSVSSDDHGVLWESVSPVGMAAVVQSFDGLIAWMSNSGRGDALLSALLDSSSSTLTSSQSTQPIETALLPEKPLGPDDLHLLEHLSETDSTAMTSDDLIREGSEDGFQSYKGEHLELHTDLPFERAEEVLLEADDAFESTWLMFGGYPGHRRSTIYITGDVDKYRAFGSGVSDDDDASKSSIYGQFCSDSSGVPVAYVVDDAAPAYTTILARQAASELALRRLPIGRDLPRWLVEGVSCWFSRYQPDESHVEWSCEALTKAGGSLPLKSFFHPYSVSHRNILQAGLLVYYAKSEDGEARVREAWNDLESAMTAGDRSQFEVTLVRFRIALEEAQAKVFSLAMANEPSSRVELFGRSMELVSKKR